MQFIEQLDTIVIDVLQFLRYIGIRGLLPQCYIWLFREMGESCPQWLMDKGVVIQIQHDLP